MNDELAEHIRKAAVLTTRHRCTWECERLGADKLCLYATGAAPERGIQRLSGLASRHGYRMVRNDKPWELGGPGCSGVTWGWVPQEGIEEGLQPYTINLQRGMDPAEEFFVGCHEMTHVLLGHPPRDETEAMFNTFKRRGSKETPDEETPCHLAAIAMAKSKGVRIKRGALCYLSRRAHDCMRAVTPQDQRNALHAATQMAAVL